MIGYQLFYYLFFFTNVYGFELLGKLFNGPFIKNRTNIIFNINSTVNEKKVITISPGGFRGFYMLGLCKYLKENYELEDYVFSGASAGAWNSLFLSLKENDDDFIDYIFDIEDEGKMKKNLEHCLEKLSLNGDKFDFMAEMIKKGPTNGGWLEDDITFFSFVTNEKLQISDNSPSSLGTGDK